MMTVQQLVTAARDRLRTAGVGGDTAATDAEVLARHVLGWDRTAYLCHRHEPATPSFETHYGTLVQRRERREPVSHITGSREFWGRDFEVTPDVLAPRPETELIIEEALALVSEFGHDEWSIVDVGTGSGCLAVTLAHECAGARITATDVSAAGLAVARRNAVRHGVAARIIWCQASLLTGLSENLTLVVSNPPYVPLAAADLLPPEVRRFEPAVALFGGPDGLDPLRGLIAQAARQLTLGGWLIVEFGAGQESALREIVRAYPNLRLVKVRHDLQDMPRTAVIRRAR